VTDFVASPNFTYRSNSASAYGVPRSFQAIVIHWWDAPANRPTIESVIGHFLNAASQVSAHYVVNDTRTVQMVNEEDIAWHAKQANPIAIGIECDPNGGEDMYRRLGALVRDIRSRRGDLPLARHSDYVATACPGTINLGKINSYANSTMNSNNTVGGEIMADRPMTDAEYQYNYNHILGRPPATPKSDGRTAQAFIFDAEGELKDQAEQRASTVKALMTELETTERQLTETRAAFDKYVQSNPVVEAAADKPSTPGTYAKTIVALLGVVGVAASCLTDGNLSNTDVQTIMASLASAFAVFVIPNKK
jgi:hypothetical protein